VLGNEVTQVNGTTTGENTVVGNLIIVGTETIEVAGTTITFVDGTETITRVGTYVGTFSYEMTTALDELGIVKI
jgi:hypothetical protein